MIIGYWKYSQTVTNGSQAANSSTDEYHAKDRGAAQQNGAEDSRGAGYEPEKPGYSQVGSEPDSTKPARGPVDDGHLCAPAGQAAN